MKIKRSLAVLLAAIVAVSVGGYAISTILSHRNSDSLGQIETTATTASAQTGDTTTNDSSASNETTAPEDEISANEEIAGENAYEYAYAGFKPVYASINTEQWNMLLVNRDYILPEGFSVKTAPSIEGDSDSERLDYRVAPHYNEMYLAAKKDGVTLTTVSGYRSVSRQKNNFENKIDTYLNQGYSKAEATRLAAKIILPPGTSEHNAGLAMDICSLDVDFEDTREFNWLKENAADYGFILRYPEDKQDITKITYEPWHWRYVGVEAAKQMKASGQCFEEYLGMD